MSFTPLKLDAVILATIATPATPVTTFAGVDRAGIESGHQFVVHSPAGHAAPTVGALAKVAPRLTFSTPQIDVAVNALTTWGIQCSARAYQKNSSGAAPTSRAGTTNVYKSIASAIAFYTRVNLPKNGVGSCDVSILAAYNGSVNPVVNNASSALVSGALGSMNCFAAGPFYLNETLVDGIQSIVIDNQVALKGDGDSSSIFDTYAEGTVTQTLITVTTLSQTSWATVTAAGLGITDLTFFAKKWQDGGLASFVANDTAEHIKFNSAYAVAAPVSSQADGQGLFLDTFQLVVTAADADTPPLTTTISQAIVAP
jgi:hypothetical protein